MVIRTDSTNFQKNLKFLISTFVTDLHTDRMTVYLHNPKTFKLRHLIFKTWRFEPKFGVLS